MEPAPPGVMERMQKAGWGGVGPPSDEIPHLHSGHGEGGLSLDKKLSMDSGYGTDELDEGQGGYLGSWSAIKKAVGLSGEDGCE